MDTAPFRIIETRSGPTSLVFVMIDGFAVIYFAVAYFAG